VVPCDNTHWLSYCERYIRMGWADDIIDTDSHLGESIFADDYDSWEAQLTVIDLLKEFAFQVRLGTCSWPAISCNILVHNAR